MKNSYRVLCSVAVMMLSIFPMAVFASQADLDAERAEFIKIFSHGYLPAMAEKARMLEDLGYSDPVIFDLVEKQALANANLTERDDIKNEVFLVKALGFSGNDKYLPTLNQLSESGVGVVRPYSKRAIGYIPRFKIMNAVVSKDLDKAPAGRLNQQRVHNLLQSGDSELIRLGVKKVYDNYAAGTAADKELLDEVQELLKKNFNDMPDDKYEDAVAWMCKTLGRAGGDDYQKLLAEVAGNSTSKKIRDYAQKSLK